ncbi:MAG: transposase [Puia sp.]
MLVMAVNKTINGWNKIVLPDTSSITSSTGCSTKPHENKKPYSTDKLSYDKEKDIYLCPTGDPMKNMGSYKRKTNNGFEQTFTKYQAENCEGCPLKSECHQQKVNRIIEVNHNLNRLRSKAEKRLKTKRGIEKRKKTLLGYRTRLRQHQIQPPLQTVYAQRH